MSLFSLSIISFGLFMGLSFLVSLGYLQKWDLNSLVAIQSAIPKESDKILSYFSFLGSAEVTIGTIGIFAAYNIIGGRVKEFLAWLLIFPATFIEIMGKFFIFHPPPAEEFLRTIKTTNLPQIHFETEFSFPSGHITRTTFIATILLFMLLSNSKKGIFKISVILLLTTLVFLMFLSRISLGEHWLSDVIGGGLLGLSAGFFANYIIFKKSKD